ncbi:hypothetical protein J6590_014206 [Homalodisca vitripennis]|nr:hypothetical protein J6590_014206 [Homalodisca vitripennis]
MALNVSIVYAQKFGGYIVNNCWLDNTLQKQNLFSISLQAAKYKASTQSVNHTSEQHHNLTAEARQICVNNTEPSLTTRITPYYNLTSDNTEPSLTTRTTPYYNLTAEARQICVNNTEPTLTTRTMPHHNLTAEARQICVNNTEPTLTTRTTPYYNLTADARQICVNNTEPTLTTRTMPHHNLTAEARQICVNNTESILTKVREHIFPIMTKTQENSAVTRNMMPMTSSSEALLQISPGLLETLGQETDEIALATPNHHLPLPPPSPQEPGHQILVEADVHHSNSFLDHTNMSSCNSNIKIPQCSEPSSTETNCFLGSTQQIKMPT